MLPEVEYRAVIKYLTKKQLSGKQILEELQNTYGRETVAENEIGHIPSTDFHAEFVLGLQRCCGNGFC